MHTASVCRQACCSRHCLKGRVFSSVSEITLNLFSRRMQDERQHRHLRTVKRQKDDTRLQPPRQTRWKPCETCTLHSARSLFRPRLGADASTAIGNWQEGITDEPRAWLPLQSCKHIRDRRVSFRQPATCSRAINAPQVEKIRGVKKPTLSPPAPLLCYARLLAFSSWRDVIWDVMSAPGRQPYQPWRGLKGQTKTAMKNPEIGTAEPFQSFSQSLCQPSEPNLEGV